MPPHSIHINATCTRVLNTCTRTSLVLSNIAVFTFRSNTFIHACTNRCMHAFNSLSSNGIYATVRISGQLCEGSHQRDTSSVRCNRRKTCVSLDKCTRHRSTVVCYCHSLHKSPADKLHGEEVCKCVYIRQHACDPCEVTRLHACMCIPMNDTMHCAHTHVGIVGIRATRGVFLGEVVMDHVEALRPMSSV